MYGFFIAVLHTMPNLVHETQIRHCAGVPRVSTPSKPPHRFRVVLSDSGLVDGVRGSPSACISAILPLNVSQSEISHSSCIPVRGSGPLFRNGGIAVPGIGEGLCGRNCRTAAPTRYGIATLRYGLAIPSALCSR